MGTIRVVDGTGHGPTPQAAFDAALADGGVERYNLAEVSSVIPAGATVERVDTMPDVGPAGHILTVVKASVVVDEPIAGAAGLAWARGPDDDGVFYEATASGPDAASTVRRSLEAGLEAGTDLRAWSPSETHEVIATIDGRPREAACAVVLAAYGDPVEPWHDV